MMKNGKMDVWNVLPNGGTKWKHVNGTKNGTMWDTLRKWWSVGFKFADEDQELPVSEAGTEACYGTATYALACFIYDWR